jgi:isopenicillin N synthase-like dioxygenase
MYAEFAEVVLYVLRSRLAPENRHEPGPAVHIRDISYLQMNCSHPSSHRRSTVMEAHEDGHILTLVTPTQRGLQISVGREAANMAVKVPVDRFEAQKEFRSIDIATDETLLVPSSPTYYLTGGHLKPLFHRVVNGCDPIRQSLMFFVNPTPSIPISAWQRNACNAGVDIHDVVDQMSAVYGQRRVSTLEVTRPLWRETSDEALTLREEEEP